MSGLHSLVIPALKTGLICAAISALYIQPYRAMVFVGPSMEPTYQSFSVLLTKPVRPEELVRGMVVIINMDSGPIVKRIAFLPGDGFLQAEAGRARMDLIYMHPDNTKSRGKVRFRRIIIPPGKVFVLGDNQPVSLDSKDFGCVDMSRITQMPVDQRPFDILCVHGCPASWSN